MREPSTIIAVLAELGERIYVPQYLNDSLARFPNVDDDWIEALRFFVNGYREAGPLTRLCPSRGGGDRCSDRTGQTYEAGQALAKNVWAKFCELGGYGPKPTKRSRSKSKQVPKAPEPYEGANSKNNPLYPMGGKDVDLITFCASLNDCDYNICAFGMHGIRTDLRKTYDRLNDIRGVGPKIASFFLRDVALRDPASYHEIQNRELLQPIDIWVRRTATLLAGDPDDRRSNLAIAKELVKLAAEAGCCDLSVNSGSWYFGSQVVGTLRDLRAALSNREALKERLQSRAQALRNEAAVLSLVSGEASSTTH
jgi:hypothetical protein